MSCAAPSLPAWATADVFAPAIALGQAIGRIGCFAAGCCYGAPWDPPFCVTFTDPDALAPLNVPLFPSQLFAFASGIVVFAVLLAYRPRRRAPGQVFWLYLVLASTARLAEDAFRGTDAKLALLPWLSATQAISLGIGLTALLLFVVFGRRSVTAAEKGPSAALDSSRLPATGTSPSRHLLVVRLASGPFLISLSVTVPAEGWRGGEVSIGGTK